MSRKRIAFTLIELLVVIAIIGILSGLIVVTMSGVTTKANIAKSQVFSNSLRNALMLNLVSEWKFDGSGLSDGTAANSSYLIDTWSQKNGAVTGAPPTVLSGNNCVSNSCLSFNAQYVTVADDPVFNFGAKMTAMVWAKAAVSGSERYLLSQYGAGQMAWLLAESSSLGKMTAYIYDDGTGSSGHYKSWISSDSVFDNAWHFVGFTWNAGTLNLYVDGKAVSSSTSGTLTTNSIWNSTASLAIGGLSSGGSFVGSMDEVRLYNETIPTARIKELYYSGLNSMFVNGKITKEDYLSRVK